jgi:hypothetical protein
MNDTSYFDLIETISKILLNNYFPVYRHMIHLPDRLEIYRLGHPDYMNINQQPGCHTRC